MTTVLAAGAILESDLLRFWIALALLLTSAKVLGHLAKRLGQPTVVGELSAGILLGPTLLGRVFPQVTEQLFPDEGTVAIMIAAVAWLGVVLLLAATGFEVDLGTLRRLGRAALTVGGASLVIPVALGYGLGQVLPDSFSGGEDRAALPLFMGVALGISALPVVAKVLRELRLAKAGVGQIMLAAGMLNDVVGWALLGVVAAVASGGVGGGTTPAVGLAIALGGALLTIVGGLTIGQRGVDRLLRFVRRHDASNGTMLGVSVIIVIIAGSITQALGVEAVLGAFVAGMVLARSPLGGRRVEQPLSTLADHVLAPVFFATAGLKVDLFAIVAPPLLWWTLAILAVAVGAKVLGGWVGARLGGFGNRDGLAIGVGLNARGALEIVVASLGLSLGVLSNEAYSAVVVMAVATSLMAPPLLTWLLQLDPDGPDEGDTGVLAQVRTALLPTRGGGSSVLAGRVLSRVLPPTASITALTVHSAAEDAVAGREAARSIQTHVDRRMRWRDHIAEDPAKAVLAESVMGYEMIALGATATSAGGPTASRVLQQIVTAATVPVLLVRSALDRPPEDIDLDRIAVGASGTTSGGLAIDLAIRMAAGGGAELSMIHIIDQPRVDRRDRQKASRWQAQAFADIDGMLAEPRQAAERSGVGVDVKLRRSRTVAEDLVAAAVEANASLLVVGGEPRHEGGAFLGHTVTHLLATAPMSVAVVINPR